MTDKPERKLSGVELFRLRMSPEELKAWRLQAAEKQREYHRKKKQLVEDAKLRAEELLPEIIAQDLLLATHENYTPSEKTIDKIRDLLRQDKTLTMESLKQKYFKHTSIKTWDKLTRALFKSHMSHVEDLGLEILQVKTDAIRTLENRIAMLNEEIAQAKKYQKQKGLQIRASASTLEMIVDCEKELIKIKLDVAKALHNVGAVGEKNKSSTSVHIHTSIPRPQEKVVETTAKKSLDELVENVD